MCYSEAKMQNPQLEEKFEQLKKMQKIYTIFTNRKKVQNSLLLQFFYIGKICLNFYQFSIAMG